MDAYHRWNAQSTMLFLAVLALAGVTWVAVQWPRFAVVVAVLAVLKCFVHVRRVTR